MIKIALILRGVPGSGKSTLINVLKEEADKKGLTVSRHSTDDKCMVDGKYQWDARLVGQRHRENYNDYVASLEAGTNIVICDNTNTKLRDYQNYAITGTEHGYKPIGIVFYPDDISEHMKRNTHEVPVETLERMKENLLRNLDTLYVEDDYMINPEQGKPGSERVKNIVARLLA